MKPRKPGLCEQWQRGNARKAATVFRRLPLFCRFPIGKRMPFWERTRGVGRNTPGIKKREPFEVSRFLSSNESLRLVNDPRTALDHLVMIR